MADIDMGKVLQDLKKHIERIQHRLNKHPNFYQNNLSNEHPYSIKDRTEAVLDEISNLNFLGAFTSLENRDNVRIEQSKALTNAMDELLQTLNYAKTLPNNPVPKKMWEKIFYYPLKLFANFFLEPKNQYTVLSRYTIQSATSTIKAAREKPSASV